VRPYLENTQHKNRAGGVAQGEGSKFKIQYHKKKKKKAQDELCRLMKAGTKAQAGMSLLDFRTTSRELEIKVLFSDFQHVKTESRPNCSILQKDWDLLEPPQPMPFL
jgi:hypothetical protein